MNRRHLLGHLVLAAACPALAQNAQGTDDDRAELGTLLPQHRLIGKTRLTVWGFQVYDARLWGLTGFTADNFSAQPFALELTYLRDFSSDDIAERSITEMRRSATLSEAQASNWLAAIQRVIPNIKSGDRVLGLNRPSAGAQFWVNGKPSGDIRDAEFARLFFGIWLSPKTSEPKMRAALLSGAG